MIRTSLKSVINMRARNIKPGFYRDAKLAKCSVEARYIVPGLWMMADRDGKLKDDPEQIKMELFPCDKWDCEKLLKELEKANHIIRYEVDGVKIIIIRKFLDHQTPHKNEIPSVLPGYSGKIENRSEHSRNGASTPESSILARAHVLNPDILNPDSLIPDSPSTSSEPEKNASEPMLKNDDVFIEIPLVGKKDETHPVTKNDIAEYEQLYPAVDVRQELRNMKGWCISNPSRKKTKTGVLRFIHSWLSRTQNRGGSGNGRDSPIKNLGLSLEIGIAKSILKESGEAEFLSYCKQNDLNPNEVRDGP